MQTFLVACKFECYVLQNPAFDVIDLYVLPSQAILNHLITRLPRRDPTKELKKVGGQV